MNFILKISVFLFRSYVSEISEPSIRGAMITMALLSHQAGFLVVFGFGMLFSWRKVALICALFPFSCFVTVLFVSKLWCR